MRAGTLLLWAESYPYELAREHTFLRDELPFLKARFERVVLIPGQRGGDRNVLPDGIEVDESYAIGLSLLSTRALAVMGFQNPELFTDLLRRPEARSVPGLKRLAIFAGQAAYAKSWALAHRRYMSALGTIFYSFWWTAATTGVGLAKRHMPRLRVVTRAHGFDLYEERHSPAYIPCRDRSLEVLDALYPDSERGRQYVLQRYARRPSIVVTDRLGVRDPGRLAAASRDGVLRIVSCSLFVSVKRVDRIVDALALVAQKHPGRSIEWTHFGTGPLRDAIETASRSLPPAVLVRLSGYSTQVELFEHYATNPIDAFVNVSESEGTPVAVMEAVACGIPVLATAVGGNTEIVGPGNGVLLDPESPVMALADALGSMLTDPEQTAPWRDGSRAIWAAQYDADRNLEAFADGLVELARSAV